MNLRKLKNQAGFTLVELIVVIAIMAILAGVAVPVYSGYIEKANKAADLQLLGAVNSAFGAAVIENGAVPQELSSASAPISGGKVTTVSASGVDSAALNASFARYFAGNETAEFKVITSLYYNKADGVFTDDAESTLNEAQKVVLNWLKDNYGGEDGKIEQYLESTFNTEITEGELLGQVDWVTGLATEAMTDGSVLLGIVSEPDYIMSLMIAAGMDPSDNADVEKFASMAYNQDGTPNQEFLANSLVLNVAQNTASNPAMGKETLAEQLANGSIKTAISGNLGDDGDPQTGLAQAAVAYGMYTAYANYIGDQEMINNAANMSSLSNLTTMLNDMYGVDDSEDESIITFEEYMAGQGQADLNGYLSALEMAGVAAGKDSDLTLDVLNNGFGGLEGVLGSLDQ